MGETSLRWRARIGSLKLIAGGVLLGVAVFLTVEVGQLSTALKNSGGPQSVGLEQLVDGTVGVGQYVAVAGYAMYDMGYEETMEGQTVTTYYLLLDDDTGHLMVVEASTTGSAARETGYVTLTGMTRSTASELENLIRSDVSTFEKAGFVTRPELYLAEGQRPPSVPIVLMTMLVLGIIAVMCVVPFFFPGVVFVPRPIDSTVGPSLAKGRKGGVRVTGRFLQLKRLEPTIQAGERTRKFSNTIANIVPLGPSNLLIYIHHILRTKLYGVVTISKQESHWGAFITGDKVMDIQPGKLYGWRDYWTVRFHYRGQKDKSETLYVGFEYASDQANFVGLLREMGFSVGTVVSGFEQSVI